MPRQPTGRPRGRPVGSGAILEREQIRLTVRIPATLFNRVEEYAEGQHYTRGTPELASVVREALEHFLVCPHKRQTENGATDKNTWQSINGTDVVLPLPHLTEDNIGQTDNRTAPSVPLGREEPAPLVHYNRQTKKRTQYLTDDLEDMPLHPETASVTPVCQPENVPADGEKSEPDYDHTRFQLGKLCSRGHAYGDTGQSLREIRQGKMTECAECHRDRARAANARRVAKQGASQ